MRRYLKLRIPKASQGRTQDVHLNHRGEVVYPETHTSLACGFNFLESVNLKIYPLETAKPRQTVLGYLDFNSSSLLHTKALLRFLPISVVFLLVNPLHSCSISTTPIFVFPTFVDFHPLPRTSSPSPEVNLRRVKMFHRTGTSHLLSLLSFWTAFVAVFSSPSPSGSDVGEVSQYYGRSDPTIAEQASKIAKRSVAVDITLFILYEAYPEYEHWAVQVGDAYLQASLPWEEWQHVNIHQDHLRISRGNEKAQFSPPPRKIKLGKAKFKDEEKKDEVIADILKWQMPVPVGQVGGNCMDFIKLVLHDFVEKGYSREKVMTKFMEEYNTRYDTVVRNVITHESK
ncbi:MAG: hypothetical protein NXY57DRAFT_967506 [Lentinula lateritia]|nr:MAG: hypothetical protein NXY57DRAFT_967506 [Lentinula lateritia]